MNRRRHSLAAWSLSSLVGVVLSLAGCSGFQVSDRPIPGSTLVVRGDWDDVATSVDVGVGWAEMAVLRSEAMGDGNVRYHVVTVMGEEGTLEATRVDGELVSLSASVSGGDERMEARLIRGVARRLGQLAGRDVAPIR